MFSERRFYQLLSVLGLWLAGLSPSFAQWLVYELRFTPEQESVNFSFYSGAYVIAPVQGGTATLVLTTEEGGQYYAVSEEAGKFFMAANTEVRRAVFSAVALTGTMQAFYTASGELNRSLLLGSDRSRRTWRVAEVIRGRLMAADDESGQGPAADGSLGMVGGAVITGELREDLTVNASAVFDTQADVTRYIVELLEKYGYAPDTGSVAAPVEPESEIDPSLFPTDALYRLPIND